MEELGSEVDAFFDGNVVEDFGVWKHLSGEFSVKYLVLGIATLILEPSYHTLPTHCIILIPVILEKNKPVTNPPQTLQNLLFAKITLALPFAPHLHHIPQTNIKILIHRIQIMCNPT